MAFDNNIVLVGNVTRDPELRFTQGGAAVCGFGIAWNQRSNQGEDKAHFFDVSCWRDLAENVAGLPHRSVVTNEVKVGPLVLINPIRLTPVLILELGMKFLMRSRSSGR